MKQGYSFNMAGTALPGAPASCNGLAAGGGAPGYAASADPLDAVGNPHFYATNADGTIYQHDVDVRSASMPESGPPPVGTPVKTAVNTAESDNVWASMEEDPCLCVDSRADARSSRS